MQGRLIYVTNQGVHELDLSLRQGRVTLIQTQSTEFGSISRVDETRFLVDTDYESKIQILDRTTLGLYGVRTGYRPIYMPTHRKFFFFQSSTATGPRLYLADLDHPTESVRQIAKDMGKFTSEPDVTPISDDEVIFSIQGDGGRTPPYHYNLITDKLKQLPFTRRCTPYVWRSVSKQLLCGIDGTGKFYLSSLDGKQSNEVDLPKGIPLLYIPQYDVLIMTITRMKWFGRDAGEHFDLWAYSFKDGKRERLVENNAPGRGGIVWIKE